MLKIFLIDDEPTQNFVNRIQLEENISFRNKIIEYTDPEKTIKVILEEENILDQIFLDLNMPIMDGWEFLETLKEETEDCKLKTKLSC